MKASAASGPVIVASASLPSLVEWAGGAARFAWEQFFFAEHHNPDTNRAYHSAVRRFLSWCDGEGVELASISPGMVGQYLRRSSRPPTRFLDLPVTSGDHGAMAGAFLSRLAYERTRLWGCTAFCS